MGTPGEHGASGVAVAMRGDVDARSGTIRGTAEGGLAARAPAMTEKSHGACA